MLELAKLCALLPILTVKTPGSTTNELLRDHTAMFSTAIEMVTSCAWPGLDKAFISLSAPLWCFGNSREVDLLEPGQKLIWRHHGALDVCQVHLRVCSATARAIGKGAHLDYFLSGYTASILDIDSDLETLALRADSGGHTKVRAAILRFKQGCGLVHVLAECRITQALRWCQRSPPDPAPMRSHLTEAPQGHRAVEHVLVSKLQDAVIEYLARVERPAAFEVVVEDRCCANTTWDRHGKLAYRHRQGGILRQHA